jgi:hypothetical protein
LFGFLLFRLLFVISKTFDSEVLGNVHEEVIILEKILELVVGGNWLLPGSGGGLSWLLLVFCHGKHQRSLNKGFLIESFIIVVHLGVNWWILLCGDWLGRLGLCLCLLFLDGSCLGLGLTSTGLF